VGWGRNISGGFGVNESIYPMAARQYQTNTGIGATIIELYAIPPKPLCKKKKNIRINGSGYARKLF
jgi:hypothetical protein